MPFTPVIPSSYRTDRQDLHDAIEALIDAFILSRSYTVGRVWLGEMPDNYMAEGPMIVLGDITETTVHDIQSRTTTFTCALYWIDVLSDREEFGNRVDAFADYMRDLFTYNSRLVDPAAGELYQTGFTDGEQTQGVFSFGAPRLDFIYRVQVGRP